MGQILEHRLDKGGLWVKAAVDKPADGTQLANYYQQVKNRVLRGFSVGGKFFRRMTPNGPRIFKCDIQEISITPQPINPRMLFSVAGKAFEGMDEVETEAFDTKALEEALERIDNLLTIAESHPSEGKAGQHADGPHIEALQYHIQKIHTLAMNTKQDSETSDEMKNRAAAIASDAEKHSKGLHHLAAKRGPLAGAYGSSMF